VWLGALLPMKAPAAEPSGAMQMRGMDLAREELAQATRSMTGASAAVHLRRLALVGCDDSEDPMRAARHLVDDVGVPAVLGFGSAREVVDVAGGLLVGRGVLAVASLSSDPRVTRIPHAAGTPQPVWRTTFAVDDLAGATARFLRDVLEPARAGAGARAVLACDDGAAAAPFADALPGQLVPYSPVAPAEADVARAAGAIGEARARFILLLGASAPCAQIMGAVESRWPPVAPRPTYVVANASLASFQSWIGSSVDRRRRIFAVQRDSSRVSNARFVLRYTAANGHGARPTITPGPSYDAFYLLAYATYALGRQPVTGASLANAFARLVPPAQLIEVGPTQVFDALALLNSGRSVDLEGAASALDFDLDTGEAPADFALLCAGVDSSGRASGADVESGVVYRAKSRRTEGALRCP
jgi:branched-chain amino acid transport system substrate-binding protein